MGQVVQGLGATRRISHFVSELEAVEGGEQGDVCALTQVSLWLLWGRAQSGQESSIDLTQCQAA